MLSVRLFLKLLFLLVTIGMVSPVHPYWISKKKWQTKSGTTIEIYGDLHREHPTTDQQYQEFVTLFNQWKYDTKKTLVLLELGGERGEEFKDEKDLISKISVLVANKNNKWGNVTFKQCDLRYDALLTHTYSLIRNIQFFLNDYSIAQLHNMVPILSCGHTLTVNMAFAQLKKHIEQMRSYANHLAPSPTRMLLTIMSDYFTTLYKHYKTALLKIPHNHEHTLIHYALIHWVQHTKKIPAEAISIWTGLIDNTPLPIEFITLFADIGFIMELHKNLSKFDRIVFCGGNAHAHAMNMYVNEILNAQPIDQTAWITNNIRQVIDHFYLPLYDRIHQKYPPSLYFSAAQNHINFPFFKRITNFIKKHPLLIGSAVLGTSSLALVFALKYAKKQRAASLISH